MWRKSCVRRASLCHCVLKGGYGFGPILLEITKLFCFGENSAGRAMCSFHFATILPVLLIESKQRNGFLSVVLRSIANRDDMQTGAHKNTLEIHSPLCISFHNIFPQTEPLNILALDDGPGASACQDQTHQTSWLYKQEQWIKRKDGTFQFIVFSCQNINTADIKTFAPDQMQN